MAGMTAPMRASPVAVGDRDDRQAAVPVPGAQGQTD